MASFLKTLAVAAGAGVAIGLCSTSMNGRRVPRRDEAPKDVLDIEPLLDRLEKLERRFEAPKPEPPVVNVVALTSRIDAQEAEIVRLREMVDTRAAEIQSRLEAEMEVRYRQTVANIEKTVEFQVSERIAAIERSLSEQSISIESLRERSQATDSNLQRLILAIERLCERVPARAAAPGPVLMRFESHLKAVEQDEAAPEFRRMFGEPDPIPAASQPEPKKSKFPLARIFGMLALVVLTQVIS